jgi:hypothetical protein
MEDLFFDFMVNNSECWLYKADCTKHHFALIDDAVYRDEGESNIYCGCIYDFDSMIIDFTDYTDISQFKR